MASPKHSKDSFETKTLTLKDMENYIENLNSQNREVNQTNLKKLRKAIREGQYNFHFYEARLIVVNYITGHILSGQHRLKALIAEGVESATFDFKYVDLAEWLTLSIEKRTAADKIIITSKRTISPDNSKTLSKYAGQKFHIDNGKTSTSGASGAKRPSEAVLAELYGEKIEEGSKAIPNEVHDYHKLLKDVVLCLFLSDKLSKKDLEDLTKTGTRMNYAFEYLKTQGYGASNGIKSLPYGIAVMYHAKNTEFEEPYLAIEEVFKPQYKKTGTYNFADYI